MNINTSNESKSKIMAAVFLIVSIVLAWQAYGMYPDIGITQEKINKQEITIKDSENILQRTKELVDFVATNKEVVDKFSIVLPADEDKANLVSVLNSTASINGLSALKITFVENINSASDQQNIPVDASASNDFDPINIKMTLRGSYFSFKNFLAATEKNLRMLDVVSVNFSIDTVSQQTEGEKKAISYDIELKTYLGKPSAEKNVAKLLSSEKFKNFTVSDLNFTKEKTFTDLFLSPNYNVNVGEDEIGNQNIF